MENNGSNTRQIVDSKPKGGFWGKFLAVFLGFLLGIVGTVAGLGFTGYYLFAKMPVEDGFNKVNGFVEPDINRGDYITDPYANKTLKDVFWAVGEASKGLADGTGNLQSLVNISPLVNKLVQ
ncbi:MAG: hypothetical protein IJV80_05985, partial [Clostridia bacterium]|nr:hypothetical protein [Clostridia bacterium]